MVNECSLCVAVMSGFDLIKSMEGMKSFIDSMRVRKICSQTLIRSMGTNIHPPSNRINFVKHFTICVRQFQRQLCTVAKRVISKIPTKSIKSEDSNDIDSDCCAICIEPYKITDIIRVLPCRYVNFHRIQNELVMCFTRT